MEKTIKIGRFQTKEIALSGKVEVDGENVSVDFIEIKRGLSLDDVNVTFELQKGAATSRQTWPGQCFQDHTNQPGEYKILITEGFAREAMAEAGW